MDADWAAASFAPAARSDAEGFGAGLAFEARARLEGGVRAADSSEYSGFTAGCLRLREVLALSKLVLAFSLPFRGFASGLFGGTFACFPMASGTATPSFSALTALAAALVVLDDISRGIVKQRDWKWGSDLGEAVECGLDQHKEWRSREIDDLEAKG